MKEPTKKQKIGQLGEDIAVEYLESRGFEVVERNFLKKCGEIDIIAQKGKILHFIEVKSVSELANSRLGRSETSKEFRQNTYDPRRRGLCNVSRETDSYRPEDNIHSFKLKRLARTIQVYLLEKYPKGEPEWVFDAITVRLDTKNLKAHVQFLENIVL